MDKKKVAKAALAAIQEHVSNEIGTRPMAQWTDHDVIDTGIICRALSDNGLPNDDDDALNLEDIVSPLVFWQWHGATVEEAMESSDIQGALKMLADGGVTYPLPVAA